MHCFCQSSAEDSGGTSGAPSHVTLFCSEIPAALFSLDSWLHIEFRLASISSSLHDNLETLSSRQAGDDSRSHLIFSHLSGISVLHSQMSAVFETTVSRVFVSFVFSDDRGKFNRLLQLVQKRKSEIYPLIFVLAYFKICIFSRWYVCVFTRNLVSTSVPTSLIVSSQTTVCFLMYLFRAISVI